MRPTLRILTTLLTLLASLPAIHPAWAQAPRPGQQPTLALSNKSGQTIEELYVSSTRMTGWGEDRLGSGIIDRNATFRLRLTEGCLYDIQVVYADKRIEERMRLNLCRTPAQVFTAAEAHAAPSVPSHEFTLENHTSRAIVSLAVADTSDRVGGEDWGDNLLRDPVATGIRRTISYEGDCQMAVRVVFDNGSSEQRHPTELCAGDKVLTISPGWTTQDDGPVAEPAELVTVTNRSAQRLVELFVHPDGSPRGDERLGIALLAPGAELKIALQRDGACLFTIEGVFEGAVPDQVQRGVDFCPRRAVDVGAPAP